jgi:hypothetical protein
MNITDMSDLEFAQTVMAELEMKDEYNKVYPIDKDMEDFVLAHEKDLKEEK